MVVFGREGEGEREFERSRRHPTTTSKEGSNQCGRGSSRGVETTPGMGQGANWDTVVVPPRTSSLRASGEARN
jgi:hypothetical protein